MNCNRTLLTLVLFGAVTSTSVNAELTPTVAGIDFQTFSSAARINHANALNAGASVSHQDFSAKVGRWMDTRIGENLKSFSISTTGGDGVNNWARVSHSQSALVDPQAWNPDAALHSVTEFSATQRFGQIWLTTTAAHTDGESQYHAGVQYDRIALSVGAGSGRSAVRLGGNMGDLDPWFFSGGRDLPFHFSGATAAFDLTSRSTVELGDWRFDMQGMNTRRTRFVGFSSGRMYGRFYDVSREDLAGVASGLELGFSGNGYGLGYREIRHIEGSSTRRITLAMNGWRKAGVAFALEKNENPLFGALEDTRFMLTFSGRLGGANTMTLGAAEKKADGESEAEQKSNRGRNIALIGGGAVLVAAAAGGGGGGDEAPSARFGREQGAAFNILNSYNPRCVRENREYGGWVYRNSDGSYSAQTPRQGDLASVDIGPPSAVPSGAVSTATYHCHGGPDPRYDNENFSGQDIFADRFYNVNGYLSTPGGKFKKHDVRTGAITTIGSIRIQ